MPSGDEFHSEDSEAGISAPARGPSESQVTMLEPEFDGETVGLEGETSKIRELKALAGDSAATVLVKDAPVKPPPRRQHEELELPSSVAIDDQDIAPDPEIGDRIQDYELLELLGRGGAGSVYKARCRRDGSIVALKVLAAKKLRRTRVVKRFMDEAKAAETVRHDCLVQLLEFIEIISPRRLAYAMEYVQGISLRSHLQNEKALHLTEAIHIARQMSRGVGELHKAGIIHRDLKPENIMIIPAKKQGENPSVKVLDFGVAKFLTGDGLQSESPGTFVGTPRYMAPEQAAGGKVDARSDLFAIGVMLFEMITGSRPHDGDTLKSVVMAKLKGAPRIEVNPGREILPQELSDVVDSCLKLKPAERPKSTEEFERVLSSAYIILSAVGPIRLVDDGGVGRNQKPERSESIRRKPKIALDDDGEKISTYVLTGGASDDFRRNQKRASAKKKKKRLPPVARTRPLQAPSYADAPKVSIKPQIAPRVKGGRRPSAFLIMLALAIAFGVGIYTVIDQGLIYNPNSVETAKPPQPPVSPRFSTPHDVLIISEPVGARILIDDSVVGSTPHRVRIPEKVESIAVTLVLLGYERNVLKLTRTQLDDLVVKLDVLKENPDKTPVGAESKDDSEEDFSDLEIEE